MTDEQELGAQELLFAMSIAAKDQAEQRLSEEGRDVLGMIELASRNPEFSVVDAWVEARATATLSEREKDVISAYVARMSLIEHFDSQVFVEDEEEEDK